MRKLFLVLLAVAAIVAGMLAQRWLNATPQAVAEFSVEFPDTEGKIHHLEEWKGKILIVNFWATWCPPCLEEMPEFVKLQTELGGNGLQFIGVAIDDTKSVKDFLASTPVNYPILIGENGGAAWASLLGNRMNILPFSAVIDRNGKLVHAQAGPFSRDDVLRTIGSLQKANVPGP